MLCACL